MTTKISLSKLATYLNGYAFKPADRGEKGLPIIRIQDLTGNSHDLAYFSGDYSNKILIDKGDVLISWSGSLGVYEWTEEKALLNQHIFKVVFDKLPVNKEYYIYAVRHQLKEMERKTHGATMKHIVKRDFENTEINYPKIECQVLIAKRLNLVKKIINLRKKQMNDLDTLVKARFVEMFGDPITQEHVKDSDIVQLGEVCKLQAGIFTKAKTIHVHADEVNCYPCYGGNGIRGYVDNYTHEGAYPIIGRQGALCGNVQLSKGKFRNTEHAVLVTPKVEMETQWLFELLNLLDLYRYHTGAAQPGLSVGTLNKVQIKLPKLQLQKQYSEFVHQVDKSKVAIQKSLDEAQTLFDSLMQEYFS